MGVFEFDAVYAVFTEESIHALFSAVFPDAKSPWMDVLSAGVSLYCENPSTEVTVDAVREKAGVSETDMTAAIRFWIRKGILRKTAYKTPKYKYADPVPLDADAMTGIFTTCVNKATLDESPFAYKPMDEIVANIEPTAEIVSRIKPIYNFKAGDED